MRTLIHYALLVALLAPVLWLFKNLLFGATTKVPFLVRVRNGASWFDVLSEVGSLTLTAADAVLKDDYKDPVVDLLNNSNVLAAMVEKNTDDFQGRRWVRALHVGRNHGVGNRPEMGTLPSAGNQKYADIYGVTRSCYARIQLSGQTIEAMNKSKGAFIRALDSEMEGAKTDAMLDVNRQYWGTSDGVIATTTNGAAGTTVTLSKARRDWMKHLEDGAGLIEIRSSDGVTVRSPAGGLAVRTVDYDAGTFVFENPDGSNAANIDTAAGDLVCRYGAYGVNDNSGNPGDGQVDITGVQTIVSDTATLHTLAPATEARWAAQVYDNGGANRAISENLVSTALMRGETRSGRVIDLLVGNDGVFRSYGNLLTSLRRLNDTVELKGGFSGVAVSMKRAGRGGNANVALTWDPDAPDNSLYGFATDTFDIAMLLDWEWMDKAGAVLVQVGDTDAYSATLKSYRDLVCTNRQANFVIQDITEQ